MCLLEDRYLYAIGGKQEKQTDFVSTIELLDLDTEFHMKRKTSNRKRRHKSPGEFSDDDYEFPKWILLTMRMPYKIWAVGALPIASDKILLFGGFNEKTGFTTNAGIMQIKTPEDFRAKIRFKDIRGFKKQDLFFNQSVIQTDKELHIYGHYGYHVFDTDL